VSGPKGLTGLPGSDGPPLGLLLVSMTIGGLGLLFAMILLGRRRRGDEPVPALAEARSPAFAGAPAAAAPSPPPVAWAVAGADVLPTEVGVPRWRRQSLRESRRRSERDIPATRVELRFRTEPEPGVERRLVAYSLVSMRSEPDELLGEEIGWLDHGDEVEVVETRGVHWLVRTPDGAVGWIHRTTLEATPVMLPGDEPASGGSDIDAAGEGPAADQGDAEAQSQAARHPGAQPGLDAVEAGADGIGSAPDRDEFFRFSTGGLGTPNGEPRIH
jgi:hypothetical protein